jgi:uncharacterized protein YegP (UPF0339 family)
MRNAYRFERFDRMTLRGRRWFFNFSAPNSKVMAQSEAYNSEAARDDAIATIKREAGAALVVDTP